MQIFHMKFIKYASDAPMVKMAFILAAFMLVLSGCHSSPPNSTHFVIYSEMWARDFAVSDAGMSCGGNNLQNCEANAKSDEADFIGNFSTLFQTTSACHGLELVIYNGVDTSKETFARYTAATANGAPKLLVNFISDKDKYDWELHVT